jgi:NADH-quinone oxidoreductase subunit K
MNELLIAGPEHIAGYLVVSCLLFALGVLTCVVRRNAVGVLLGIELMLNAAALNFITFARFRGDGHALDGQTMTLFVIVLAAAEATVALALVFAVKRAFSDVDLEATKTLHG